MTRLSFSRTALAAGLALAACRDPQPVARLTAQPRHATLAHGRCVSMTLTWEMLRPLEKQHGSPKTFVHLYNDQRRAIRTFDHAFPGPWVPGTSRAYSFVVCDSVFDPPLPAGRYFLRAGLYDSKWGYRWRLDARGPELGPRAYGVTEMEIVTATAPRFAFTGRWSGAELTKDLQTPARMHLDGTGRIDLCDAAEGTRVAAMVVVPDHVSVEVNDGRSRWTMAPGSHTVETPPAQPSFLEFRTTGGTMGLEALGVEMYNTPSRP